MATQQIQWSSNVSFLYYACRQTNKQAIYNIPLSWWGGVKTFNIYCTVGHRSWTCNAYRGADKTFEEDLVQILDSMLWHCSFGVIKSMCNRIRQVAPICAPSNTWLLGSMQVCRPETAKLHLNMFSRFCRFHGSEQHSDTLTKTEHIACDICYNSSHLPPAMAIHIQSTKFPADFSIFPEDNKTL